MHKSFFVAKKVSRWYNELAEQIRMPKGREKEYSFGIKNIK